VSAPGLRAAAAFLLGFGVVVCPCAGLLEGLSGPRRELLAELNAQRELRGLQPVRPVPQLGAEARRALRSWLQRARGEADDESHPTADDALLRARLPRGRASAQRVIGGWLAVDASRARLLAPELRAAGVAVADSRRGLRFYVARLGTGEPHSDARGSAAQDALQGASLLGQQLPPLAQP
jgi:hypothetical protein